MTPGASTWPGDTMARKRVAVSHFRRGSNMVSLIEAAKAEDYPAEIALVIFQPVRSGRT